MKKHCVLKTPLLIDFVSDWRMLTLANEELIIDLKVWGCQRQCTDTHYRAEGALSMRAPEHVVGIRL